MTKGMKVIFVASVLLNIILIIGFVLFRNYVKTTMFRGAAMTAQAETMVLKNILTEIDSNDPARIAALKESLPKQIENCQKAAAIWERAAHTE